MEQEEIPMCPEHKVENDLFCITCNKAICIFCKCVHPKDHMQIIHLAELAAHMIIQVKTRLDTLKGALEKESCEIESMNKEFEEDKRYLYAVMKRLERIVIQMLHASTAGLTKSLQKTDSEIKSLREKLEEKKSEFESSEKLLKQIVDLNSKKDYWKIYLIQDKLKKGGIAHQYNPIFNTDLKKDAIKEAVSRGQANIKSKIDPSAGMIPAEMIAKKEEIKKSIAVTDFAYLSEIGKEMTKAINIINKRFNNEIAYLKQSQNIVFIKNNPDPLIKKHDKSYLANWILGPKSTKNIELELLYKGTQNGFLASEFHLKCDTKFPTLSLIKSESDEIFGGFTYLPWASPSPGVFREDPGAFTFSLNKKAKCSLQNDKKNLSVRHLEGLGVVFGTEIVIGDNSNIDLSSHVTGGSTYSIPEGCDPKTFYTNDAEFNVKEIEVYKVKIT